MTILLGMEESKMTKQAETMPHCCSTPGCKRIFWPTIAQERERRKGHRLYCGIPHRRKGSLVRLSPREEDTP